MKVAPIYTLTPAVFYGSAPPAPTNVHCCRRPAIQDPYDIQDPAYSTQFVPPATNYRTPPSDEQLIFQLLLFFLLLVDQIMNSDDRGAPMHSSSHCGRKHRRRRRRNNGGTDNSNIYVPVIGNPNPPKVVENKPLVSKPNFVKADLPPESNGLPANKKSIPSKSGIAALDRWDSQIQAAAVATGLPANYIKATIWAESRGNPNDPSQNPDGDHTDLGVMQISDYTYGDVMKNQPNAPRGLHASNPADNIMMGAWELKDKLGRANGDYNAASAAYVGTGSSQYVRDVMEFWNALDNGTRLRD